MRFSLQDYLKFLGQDVDSEIQFIIDDKQKHYLLVEIGWQKNRRIYGCLIHLDIINDKIWIQQDGTEEGIANELVKQGISPQQIVLAFKTLERRKITDFAVFSKSVVIFGLEIIERLRKAHATRSHP